LSNGVLTADAYLESELTNYATDQQLLFQSFTKPIAFDTEYLVSLHRNGNQIIFGLDDEKIVYNITTPTYPPSSAFAGDGYRRLVSQAHGTSTSNVAGASGIFITFVDDVYTGVIASTGSGDSASNSGGGGSTSLNLKFLLAAIGLLQWRFFS
jgi:hypothetical protein